MWRLARWGRDTGWPNYDHKFATMSYEALIKSHALDYAKDLAIPYLGIVGSEAITKPYAERFIAEMIHDQIEVPKFLLRDINRKPT